jgi:transcriptional/translational regulatory protein YebC/TACO1
MTDNRNRTASEIRNLIQRGHGNLGASGSVGWMFKKQGMIVFEKSAVDENAVTDQAIELGAEDIRNEGEALIVVTEPKEFERIREALKAAKTGGAGKGKLPDPISAEVTMVPQNVVKLTGKDAEGAVKLVSMLEDHDDVQNVYSNMDVDESVLESVG